MAISIDALAIVDYLLKKRFSSKQKVADYLDCIAEEANSLARVWEGVVTDLQARSCVKVAEEQFPELQNYIAPNAPYYARLAQFYSYLSVAVGGKLDDKWHQSMAQHLGWLLYDRELTAQAYRKTIEKMDKSIIFMDDSIIREDLMDLIKSVEALHKEAAKIHVLAKTVRAM